MSDSGVAGADTGLVAMPGVLAGAGAAVVSAAESLPAVGLGRASGVVAQPTRATKTVVRSASESSDLNDVIRGTRAPFVPEQTGKSCAGSCP